MTPKDQHGFACRCHGYPWRPWFFSTCETIKVHLNDSLQVLQGLAPLRGRQATETFQISNMCMPISNLTAAICTADHIKHDPLHWTPCRETDRRTVLQSLDCYEC